MKSVLDQQITAVFFYLISVFFPLPGF